MRRAVIALLSAVVVVLTTVTGGAAAPRVPTPGAAGIGDPYWPTDGNGGYDVQHYDLRLSYAPTSDLLTGVATLRARTSQELSRFNLDLQGLTVDSVRVNRVSASWTRSGAHELQITPASALPPNATFDVMIGYHGKPEMISDEFGPSGFYTTGDGAIIAGQPHVAATWFPANDHPLDKATFTMAITVPRQLQAVANGALRSVVTRGGRRIWTWTTSEPMAPYLATMAIGTFDVRHSLADRISYTDALDPALFAQSSGGPGGSIGARAQAALRKQPAIVRFLSGVLGPYPFRQAGGIVDDDPGIGFALENQTRAVYAKEFFTGPDTPDDDLVVVHELAHQWSGDSVALARWSDIWLNEGFATYAEWMWLESQGRDTTDAIFADLASTPADDSFWDLPIGAPGAARIFDDPVYDRGALTMHALRRLIGDTAFRQLTRRWFSTYAQRNATTADFIATAEAVAARDLDTFFRAWLFSPTKPSGLPAAAARRDGVGDRSGASTTTHRPHRPHRPHRGN